MIRQMLKHWLPEWSFRKNTRLDHEPMYICTIVAMFITSVSTIIIGPTPGSVISSINDFTQVSMSWVLILSSAFCLYGSLRGTRFLSPKADLRDSYLIAKWASIGIVVSMGVYGFAIFTRYEAFLLSTVSGALVIGLVAGILWKAWDFANEIDKLDEELRHEIEEDE